MKKLLLVIITLTLFACSSNDEMNDLEKQLAKKFNAEYIALGFKQEMTSGSSQSDSTREYLLFEMINSKNFLNINHEDDSFNQECERIVTYLTDSINYQEIPFQPKEVQIDIISKNDVWVFESSETKTITYNLSPRN